ncbi:MAG: hypothetical protein QXI39_07915 [Candidatus Bathyarchaeia archaeon]
MILVKWLLKARENKWFVQELATVNVEAKPRCMIAVDGTKLRSRLMGNRIE